MFSFRESKFILVLVNGWQWCWWHRYVGDFMMVTDFRYWWQNHYVGDFFRYIGDFLNVLNRSPTSQTCHQHIWSPSSVANIDVTRISTKLIISICSTFLSNGNLKLIPSKIMPYDHVDNHGCCWQTHSSNKSLVYFYRIFVTNINEACS